MRENNTLESENQTAKSVVCHTTLSSTPAPPPGKLGNALQLAEGKADFFTTLIGTFHVAQECTSRLEGIPALENMSVHLWRLEKDTDEQSPHKEDEIYYIVEGRGKITVGGDRTPGRPSRPGEIIDLCPGDLIFVPRSTWHQFHDIDKTGLLILVFFSPNFTGGRPWPSENKPCPKPTR